MTKQPATIQLTHAHCVGYLGRADLSAISLFILRIHIPKERQRKTRPELNTNRHDDDDQQQQQPN